jgi:hypothetical protein
MNPMRKAAIAAAVVGATVTGGAIGASFIGSAAAQEVTVDSSTAVDSSTSVASNAPVTAADSTTPSADASTPPSDTPAGRHGGGPGGDPSKGGHQANGITETILTGDEATKVTEAATAAVPGATIYRVETDAEGAAFEAHVTKADGSKATVKLNADYSVANIEDGMK